jgi:hypothetical protein
VVVLPKWTEYDTALSSPTLCQSAPYRQLHHNTSHAKVLSDAYFIDAPNPDLDAFFVRVPVPDEPFIPQLPLEVIAFIVGQDPLPFTSLPNHGDLMSYLNRVCLHRSIEIPHPASRRPLGPRGYLARFPRAGHPPPLCARLSPEFQSRFRFCSNFFYLGQSMG